MNIVLIGYRGTGKTTIGRGLAARLGRDFFDTDGLVAERAGKTIKEIFEGAGEEAFREMESAEIEAVSRKEEAVIAVGGGAILRAQNVAALKRKGKLIWLQADAETLFARIRADVATAAGRPNLMAGGGVEEVRALLAVRMALYRAAADVALDVSCLPVEDAIEQLSRLIGSDQGGIP